MKPRVAIIVTTFNRPWALARTLPSLTALAAPILIVDDGSDHRYRAQYEEVYARYRPGNFQLIRFPENRGKAAALNVGLAYWLADPGIHWISVFDDDVTAQPDVLVILARVQDPQQRPLLTGYSAAEHPVITKTTINEVPVTLRNSTSGVHLHAHRDYWSNIMPIPTRELGAPKQGIGSNTDWWIGTWSPHSVARRGGYITCVGDQVFTFATSESQSTWMNGAPCPVDDPVFPREKSNTGNEERKACSKK